MKEWYQQTKEEILGQFQVTEQGLTSFQAEKILAEKGENVLEEGKRKSTLQVFLEQFCDLLVVILIIAALISMVSGNVESTVVILLSSSSTLSWARYSMQRLRNPWTASNPCHPPTPRC